MEIDIKRNCDLCLKDFTGLNEENINRHVKACIKKKLVKRNKNKVSQKRKGAISNYFIPEKKCASQDLEEDFGASKDDEINITTSREIDLDLVAVVFEEDTILPETEAVEVDVIKETNTDVKEHEECCTSIAAEVDEGKKTCTERKYGHCC